MRNLTSILVWVCGSALLCGCGDELAPRPIAGGPAAAEILSSYVAAEEPAEDRFSRLAAYRELAGEDGDEWADDEELAELADDLDLHDDTDEGDDGAEAGDDDEGDEEDDDDDEYDEYDDDDDDDEALLEGDADDWPELRKVKRGKWVLDIDAGFGTFVDAKLGLEVKLPGRYWDLKGVAVGGGAYGVDFLLQDKNIFARIDTAVTEDVVDFSNPEEAKRRVAMFVAQIKADAEKGGATVESHSVEKGSCGGATAMMVSTLITGDLGIHAALLFKNGRKHAVRVYGKSSWYADDMRTLLKGICASLKLPDA